MTARRLPGDAGDATKAGLYRIVIIFLGIALLAGIGSLVFLTAIGRDVPEGIVALASAAGGALVATLAPSPTE